MTFLVSNNEGEFSCLTKMIVVERLSKGRGLNLSV